MRALTKNLVIISFDCLAANDYELIHTLPNFQRIFCEGAYVQNVETIYPSLTYPCHTTIVTGNYPIKHGIINNTLLQPGVASPDWNWFRSAIKGTTLYDEASRANMTVAALLWPVTGRAKGIKYNLPEIFANRPWQNQIMVSLFSGTPGYQWELNQRFGHIRNGLNQPELDDFILESTIHTIKTKRPNVLMAHFTDLDTKRHHFGAYSEEAKQAIHRHDVRLGKIIGTLEECGLYEETAIVILGDHTALDVNKAVSLNVRLREKGLIDVNRKGKLTAWKAYCKTCDGSAYIYLNDQHDEETVHTVEQMLQHLVNDPESGIEQYITGEQAGKRGADSQCAFMIEASEGFYFIEDYEGSYIKHVTREDVQSNKKYMLACHGYSLDKPNYKTFFMAAGKGIRQGVTLPSMKLVDIGPTLASLLGLDLGETDGEVIYPLLETETDTIGGL
ncbi:alkaline phosphatase family protein [Bacillus sp. AGMB 02131]|uniref:Alkaline phosphatase family protein n=1 Tax=Peribacillus faecalis TaxID=2772559 RepID=A0A927HCI3_9BACI|nr:ectonucleotide pyrophosphatase/phosphodiesterase [Peribacillus faecalis]MBD3110064.1 alkaline phosphatase family protein [Peribacillus faecalis]